MRGFDLVEEQNIALDENDPDRWVIITTKLKHPHPKRNSNAPRKKEMHVRRNQTIDYEPRINEYEFIVHKA